MARGGTREGTPGKGYSNRTDLMQNRAPQDATHTAASAGQPVSTLRQDQTGQQGVYPEDIPRLDDPTARPGEPITHGLLSGPGAGPEAVGPTPPDQVASTILAAYMANPTPELLRVITRARAQGLL